MFIQHRSLRFTVRLENGDYSFGRSQKLGYNNELNTPGYLFMCTQVLKCLKVLQLIRATGQIRNSLNRIIDIFLYHENSTLDFILNIKFNLSNKLYNNKNNN